MFLHCDDCGWQQDDFYDENYNPTKYLEFWNKYLFGEFHNRLDNIYSDDAEFVMRHARITTREFISVLYSSFAERIKSMKWITYEDYKSEANKVCPKCRSLNLKID